MGRKRGRERKGRKAGRSLAGQTRERLRAEGGREISTLLLVATE